MDERSLRFLEETAERVANRLKEVTAERDALRADLERVREELERARHLGQRRDQAVRGTVTEALALLDEE